LTECRLRTSLRCQEGSYARQMFLEFLQDRQRQAERDRALANKIKRFRNKHTFCQVMCQIMYQGSRCFLSLCREIETDGPIESLERERNVFMQRVTLPKSIGEGHLRSTISNQRINQRINPLRTSNLVARRLNRSFLETLFTIHHIRYTMHAPVRNLHMSHSCWMQ
jgi:hypothetical protein